MDGAAPASWAERLPRIWQDRGVIASALWPLSLAYRGAVALRLALYRIGWLGSARVDAQVVMVGNLIAGGAGKTPTVIAVVDALRRHGYTPGIVSRGYGAQIAGALEVTPGLDAQDCGDEPLLLRLRTGAPVVVGRDRVEASRELLRRHPAVDVIVSDDGLQHRALARDAQVLVFDARGAGNGWLLPAGPLREPLPRAVPPRSLVLYNAPAASTPLPGACATRGLSGAVALADWWDGKPATPTALDALRGRPLVAAAGVAQPTRFFEMLSARGLTFTPRPLPDHHDYATLPWDAGAGDVIVTEKDAIKLQPRRTGTARVWVAPLDFAFDADFEAALLALLGPPGSRHGNTPA